MNLTKLFSWKYLKENLKKSKGILLLICILVPVFTTLSVTFESGGPDIKRVANSVEISLINIFGMFFIPITISYVLFGYVFKKNSVDLINSMPLKRSTVFITNTIGGIILITLIQVVTAILLMIVSLVSKTIYIFPAMIFDMFLMMWLAYIFIFIASNIAMSVSGTFLTQCAVTLLILFLIPFCIASFNRFEENNKIIFTENDEIVSQYVYTPNYRTFTLPSSIIYNGFMSGDLAYLPKSLIRTALLSVVYIFIGLKLFEKRKMENAEESFESYKVHLIIKALTMVPMFVLVHYIKKMDGVSIILYTLIIFYYFAYDFIVKKKIPFKYSIPALCIITFSLIGICNVSDWIYDKLALEDSYMNINDIKEIGLDFGNTYGYYESDTLISYTSDKELINTLIEIEKNKKSGNDDAVLEHSILVSVRDKHNKEVSFHLNVGNDEINKIAEILDKGYINALKKDYTENGVISFNNIEISDKNVQKDIDDELKLVVNIMNAKQFIEFKEFYKEAFEKKIYINHMLISRLFPIDTSNEMLKLFADYQNKQTMKVLQNVSNDQLDSWYYGLSIENELINDKTSTFDSNYGNYYFSYYEGDVIKYIISSKDSDFDSTKNYYMIRGNYNHGRYFFDFYYLTNDIKQINEIVKKDMKKVKEENVEYYEKEGTEYTYDTIEEKDSNEI